MGRDSDTPVPRTNDMLLHVDPIAPNVRRVLMFLAEKDLTIPTRSVVPGSRELKTPEYLAKNPTGQIPLLETPDGLFLAESMAICRYLDECFPEVPLFGRALAERAEIHMWTRRIEFQLFVPAVEYGHHSHPMMRDLVEQIPAMAEENRLSILRAYEMIEGRLAESPFVAGDRFSIADIVAYCGLELAMVWGCPQNASQVALGNWKNKIDQRPSAAVARYSAT